MNKVRLTKKIDKLNQIAVHLKIIKYKLELSVLVTKPFEIMFLSKRNNQVDWTCIQFYTAF